MVHNTNHFLRFRVFINMNNPCFNHEKPSSPFNHKTDSPCLYGFNNTATIPKDLKTKGGVK